jgi:hypothetical protein
MIALPKMIIPLFIFLYYFMVIYLSRKLFLQWMKGIISTIEFLLLILAAWLIPFLGAAIAYVITKFKKS